MEQSAKTWGFTLPDHVRASFTEENVFEYFPENQGAIELFSQVSDQWIMGPAGPIGISMTTALQFVQPLSDGTVLCPVEDIAEAIHGLKAISSKIIQLLAEKK